MIRMFFKVLSFWWLFKALSRGPRSGASYLLRREVRRTANRQIRKLR